MSGNGDGGLDVITPPAAVLSLVIEKIAQASPIELACLQHCQSCRNRLLYVLDTAPYDGDAAATIAARLAALSLDHPGHVDHQGLARDNSDRNPPRIRWITP